MDPLYRLFKTELAQLRVKFPEYEAVIDVAIEALEESNSGQFTMSIPILPGVQNLQFSKNKTT